MSFSDLLETAINHTRPNIHRASSPIAGVHRALRTAQRHLRCLLLCSSLMPPHLSARQPGIKLSNVCAPRLREV